LLLGDHDSSLASRDPPGDSVVLPDLVDPSLSRSTRAAFPLAVGWSTKGQVKESLMIARLGLLGQVDVAVEGLLRRDVLL